MSNPERYGSKDFGKGELNERLDANSLIEEIGLDASEREWRKEFIGFDDEDVQRLRKYEPVFRDNAEQVAEDFYRNLTAHEETVEVMGRSPKGIEQLKRTQSAYLVSLVEGEYGEEYFRNRARIGKLHDMLEMPMKQYIGQYSVYYDLILSLVGERLTESLTEEVGAVLDQSAAATEVASVIESEVDDAIRDTLSILRVINLDMQVVTDTYIHSYSQQLEETIAENEQLMRAVETEVQQPVGDLQTTARDVAENATTISEAAESQSERIGDISAEVSDLSATVEEVASTASQVESASSRAETLAEDGQDAADDAAAVMDDIGSAVDDAREDVSSLRERVQEIDEFADAINDIADQTNMLALNASIEAARAGEAGQGFAVVADEIKQLAGESQDRAGTVEEMVADIRADTEDTVESLTETATQVDRGVGRVQDAMESLTDIVSAVEETAEGITEVASATDDQAATAEEIASMVDEVVGHADRVAEEAEQLAAANEEQAAMVSEVEQSIARLSGDEARADGGVVADAGHDDPDTTAWGDDVSVPEDLPAGIPEFVVEMLSPAELRAVARGDLDPDDLR